VYRSGYHHGQLRSPIATTVTRWSTQTLRWDADVGLPVLVKLTQYPGKLAHRGQVNVHDSDQRRTRPVRRRSKIMEVDSLE